MKWKGKLINELEIALKKYPLWNETFHSALKNNDRNIHLAIFVEPYLTLILNGKKKIESRFSINRVIPFGKVQNGDIVIIKKSGGDILGAFLASEVRYLYGLSKTKMELIKSQYSQPICSDVEPTFWEDRMNSNYLTLITVGEVINLDGIHSEKQDRAAWSIIRTTLNNTLFQNEK